MQREEQSALPERSAWADLRTVLAALERAQASAAAHLEPEGITGGEMFDQLLVALDNEELVHAQRRLKELLANA